MKKTLFIKLWMVMVLCAATTVARAQWSLGVRGGWDYTSISRSNVGRIDETYSPLSGYEVGLQARYGFKDWIAITANLTMLQRSHRMDRHLNYLDELYTEHRNHYLMLPIMADFSFGGQKVRGHLLAGGYVGCWLNDHIKGKTYWMTDYYVYFNDFNEIRPFTCEDQRFCAGLTGGVGVSYLVHEHWRLNLDALFYYDLTSHHRGYEHLQDPRYLNTLSVCLGVSYQF